MPTYTYECKKCGHTMDHFHGMNASPRIKCDQCGGACRKLMGVGAGLIFKGSGFYETDYKRAKSGDSNNESGNGSAGQSKEGQGTKESGGGNDSQSSGDSGSSSSNDSSSESKSQ